MQDLIVDSKTWRRDLQIREHPLWLASRAAIEQLIEASRTVDSQSALRDWNAAMFDGVYRGEGLVSSLDQRLTALRQTIRTTNDEVVRRDASQLLKAVSYERETARAVLAVLRGICDSGVWRLLEFNRPAITVIGDGRPVAHLSDGDGLVSELESIDRQWHETGNASLLCDLTNCLRHADLLLIESWAPRSWSLYECKAGDGLGQRAFRQRTRLEQLEQLLEVGGRERRGGVERLQFTACPVEPRSYHSQIAELIRDAQCYGSAAGWLEHGVYADVLDQRDPRTADRSGVRRRRDSAMDAINISPNDVLMYSTGIRRIRDRRATFASQAPLALLPYSAGVVTDICMGALDITISIDARQLERRLALCGVAATVARGKQSGEQFMSCTFGEHAITVPAPMREQVLIEGMTLDSVVDILHWMADRSRDSPTDRTDTALSLDEHEFWALQPE